MSKIGIIGGSGLTSLSGVKISETRKVDTPYGSPSSTLTFGSYGEKEIVFLPRHGSPHTIPPHKINYRANIYALKENDVENIIAVNAVGGITSEMHPGRIVIPEQIIDFTYGRNQTFYEDDFAELTHIDFTHPYSVSLREQLAAASLTSDLNIFVGGVYAATQGPRLETAAEIRKIEKDGCDIVGMTGMPEATLAREMNVNYACLSLVVNWAAGKSEGEITNAVFEKHLEEGIEKVKTLLERVIPDI
jgi:5'-methylthioadenosine phosphorylase/5'-methylthioinosine phosphorylase